MLLGVTGALAVVISGLAPLPARTVAAGVALGAALICRISLAATVRQSSQAAKKGTPQQVWSTGMLWCVVVALAAAAAILLAAALRVPGAQLRIGLAAAIPAALALLVLRIVLTRRRN